MESVPGETCPIPIAEYPNVLLAHGGGGRLTQKLIENIFIPSFRNPLLEARHDGAVIELNGERLAFSTDSYVVKPLFFPGGDIGTLAVHGTLNDLAMCGACPRYLSAGFILEEGLPMETLWRVTQSMKRAAEHANVQLVTGDTKVVDKGKGDGIFINTSGIGVIPPHFQVGPHRIETGDVVLLNGDLGRHGMAIMAAREGLAFESEIESDCADLSGLVTELVDAGIDIHCMRDLTRGGLASALIELAETAEVSIRIEEKSIPVCEDVRGACEILGLDPIYVANEGRFICLVAQKDAERSLNLIRRHSLGKDAQVIGCVTEGTSGDVILKSKIGADRLVPMLTGEQLPRIC